MIWSDIPAYLVLLSLGLTLDLALGHRLLLGRLPTLDTVIHTIPPRMRALAVAVALLLGLAIDYSLMDFYWSWPVLALVLARSFSQTAVWRSLKDLSGRIAQDRPDDPHTAVRMGLVEACRRFSDGLMTGTVLLALLGFSAWLPFAVISAAWAQPGEKSLEYRPTDIAGILGLAGAPLASIYVRLAGLVTRKWGTFGPGQRSGILPGRLVTMRALARCLSLQFRVRQAWFGPTAGRARAELTDLADGVRLRNTATLLWLAPSFIILLFLLPASGA